jgi:hypothetical protein
MAAAARWEAAGKDPALFARLGCRRDRQDGGERLEWLVESVLPRGLVTLLAGAPEIGKSTLASELIVAMASERGRREWLGHRIAANPADGVAVLLTGEDSAALVNARLERLDPNDEAKFLLYALDNRSLADICYNITAMPKVALLIVDPARRYLQGDEDGSDGVNAFFATLEELARRTGAAVLVLHHLVKNVRPQTLQQVREMVRGSSVWLDRPRVVIGVYRRRDITQVGICKHNLPPSYGVMDETAFRRDAASLRHLPVSGAAEPAAGRETDALEHRVLAAIKRIVAAGGRVTRTGTFELWAHKASELAGIGRDRVRAAVDALIEDGVLVHDAGVVSAAE